MSLEPGIYILENDFLTNGLQIIRKLEHIPYSIIKLDRSLRVDPETRIYSNVEYKIDPILDRDPDQIRTESVSSQIGVENLWNNGYNGSGVNIAIVDTGIEFSHPSLTGKKVAEQSFVSESYGYEESEGPEDNNGHGTKVASLASGFDSSSNFKASGFGSNLYNVKVGSGSGVITAAGLLAGLDWVFSIEDVDIVSISLSESEEGASIDVLEEMLNTGVKTGKLVFASAGNRNTNGASTHDPFRIGSPSSAPETISVGAVDSSNNLAYFSSEGPTFGYEAKPDIVGPGVSVSFATGNSGYGSGSGTSFSTPIVAGGVASIISALNQNDLSYNPGLLKSGILDGTTILGHKSYQEGFGLLNASKVVDLLMSNPSVGIIGPKDVYIPQGSIPINVDYTIPLTLISSQMGEWNITTETNNFNIHSSIRYSGYTSIYEVTFDNTIGALGDNEITLKITTPSELTLTYNLTISYTQAVQKKILLDITHTPYNSLLGSSSQLLERYIGRDLIRIREIMEDQDIWIQEFYLGELTFEILNQYDLLWIPSSFTILDPKPYDHEIDEPILTQSELFDIQQYISHGGRIIADFDGYTSLSYSSEPHEHSLISLMSLLQINFEEISDTYPSTGFSSVNGTSGFSPEYTIMGGRYEFDTGIPLVSGATNFSAVGMINEYGGRYYVHNTRNFRDFTRTTSQDVRDYIGSVVNWVLNNSSISAISIEDNSDIKYIFDGLSSEIDNISVYISLNNRTTSFQFQKISDTQLEVTLDNVSEDDLIYIEIMTDNGHLKFFDRINLKSSNIENTQIQEGNATDFLYVEFDNPIVPSPLNFKLNQNNVEIPSEVIIVDNQTVLFEIDSNYNLDDNSELENMNIIYLNSRGKVREISLQTTINGQNDNNSAQRSFLIPTILVGSIIVGILVIQKRSKK